MKWNGSHLTSIVKQMRNYSVGTVHTNDTKKKTVRLFTASLRSSNDSCNLCQDESVCYMHAFVAAPSWETLTMQNEDVDLDDYDALLWAAKPALQDISTRRLKLPIRAARPKARKMWVVLFTVSASTISVSNSFKNIKNGCWFQDGDAAGDVWDVVWWAKGWGRTLDERTGRRERLQLHNEVVAWLKITWEISSAGYLWENQMNPEMIYQKKSYVWEKRSSEELEKRSV